MITFTNNLTLMQPTCINIISNVESQNINISYHIQMQIALRPMEASLTRDTDLIGRMDPYVKVYLGGQMNRSSVCEGGGKNPHWNDTFYLTVQGDPMMRVEVFDDDNGRDDLVGMGNYNLMQNINQGVSTTIWVDVFHNGQNVGRVCFGIQFNQQGGMGMNMGGGMGGGYGGGMGGGMGGGYGGGMGGGNPINQGGWGGGNMGGGGYGGSGW